MKRLGRSLACCLISFLPTLCLNAQFNPPSVSVLTQRYNNQRTSANLQEQVLTVAGVSSPEFQKLYTIPTDGQVYAQPLLISRLVPHWPPGPPGIQNVLIVATMNNTVAAFIVDDAIHGSFSPQLMWSTTIGPAVRSNFMPMANSTYWFAFSYAIPIESPPPLPWPLPPIGISAYDLVNTFASPLQPFGLYNINPIIGILSTPVIETDIAGFSGTIFVVGKVSGAFGPENDLVAIDLNTGKILRRTVVGANVAVAGSSSDSQNGVLTFNGNHQMQRPALLLQNGELYIAFGAHQDTTPFHGWVFRYDPKTLTQTGFWCTTPNAMGAGIWQSGGGIAGDDNGSVYVTTGNGEEDNGTDNSYNLAMFNYANMIVQLDPELAPVGVFPAQDESNREKKWGGLDLGSSGPVLIPGANILLAMDKESLMFVLATDTHLGMRQIFQAGQQADTPSPGGGAGFHHTHGSPALWRGPQGMTAYFWPERDYLRAFVWDDAKAVFDCNADPNGCESGNTTIPDQQSALQSPTCYGCMPGGILSISANGSAAGTGIVWASVPFNTIGRPADAVVGGGLNNVTPGVLHAFNAEDITQDLWNSELNSSRDGSFMFAKFVPPMVANGRVYMATFGSIPSPGATQTMSGSINVYGMRQWAKFLSQSYPSAPVLANATFQVSVTLFNVGTTTWTKNAFSLGLLFPFGIHPLGTPTSISLPSDVPPGSPVTFTFNLPASNIAGAYQYQWQMQQTGIAFGDPTPSAAVRVGGVLSEQQSPAGNGTKITISDSATKLPVSGATVTIDEDAEKVSFKTDSQGDVFVSQSPRCFKGSILGNNGKPIPIYGPCSAQASKQPDYGEIYFFVPSP